MRSDVIVIGGGMVGAAIAYGLARAGARVRVLDEGDTAFRAARGNFGLTWVQTKGLGNQPYFELTRNSVDGWADFASDLHEASGVDLAFRRNGGLIICVGEEEAEKRKRFIGNFKQQAGHDNYDCDFIDRNALQDLFPNAELGPEVTGASFSPMDGHVNPLFLLRAMSDGLQKYKGSFHAGHAVQEIRKTGNGFEVNTGSQIFSAEKVVIAAGLGTGHLAQMIGLDVPVRPQRGQILVTDRTEPVFPYPMSGLRQTDEGTVMIGATREDVGFDTGTTVTGYAGMTRRAVATFPMLAQLRLVRGWGALRVLTPDGGPVYVESEACPGAFVATCHSGVTLAAMHAKLLPRWVLEDRKPTELQTFGPERFHVQPAA
ncbi:MAG: FAD-binding oxidoreductase [Hyphomicrobiaceae bacterium]|nr:FAD-binding oxidoreductase [Hyphomicrobiaceae bacterium]